MAHNNKKTNNMTKEVKIVLGIGAVVAAYLLYKKMKAKKALEVKK